MKFKEYNKTLPLAEKIYNSLYGKPNTSIEIADRYNKVGVINRLLINEKQI